MNIGWRSETNLNYEIAPTPIVEDNVNQNVVYVPSNSGVLTAVDRRDGKILWKHKISNCLITNVTPAGQHLVIATTMDGKIACLKF
jgi:outer membrane protein assembly factor BamB